MGIIITILQSCYEDPVLYVKHLAENLFHSCRFLVTGGFSFSSYGEELTNEVKEVIEGCNCI